MSKFIRQAHRWIAIAFVLVVIANFAALGFGYQAEWLYYLPLPPLFLLDVLEASTCSLCPTWRGAGAEEEAMSIPRLENGVVLLSGGNPQIPKGYGDGPVQAYLDAIPVKWKQDVSRRIDKLIEKTVPGVLKAVKWNTPMCGMEPDHYFLGFHMFDRYVKVSFNLGAKLTPMPPGTSKQANVRYLDIHEDDAFDEAQFSDCW